MKAENETPGLRILCGGFGNIKLINIERGQSMTTTATMPDGAMSAAMTRGSAAAEPPVLKKRIGSTTFLVNVRFSSTSTETLEDKIHRLMQREVDKVA